MTTGGLLCTVLGAGDCAGGVLCTVLGAGDYRWSIVYCPGSW